MDNFESDNHKVVTIDYSIDNYSHQAKLASGGFDNFVFCVLVSVQLFVGQCIVPYPGKNRLLPRKEKKCFSGASTCIL